MSEPALTLVRHGQTEWSENGRHTSITDLPLLAPGRRGAENLATVLDPATFDLVLCSPRRRARETARLAGFSADVVVDEDLVEWAYGDYEGLTSPQIRESTPDWDLWRHGSPGGESPAQVTARVDRVIARALACDGVEVILFAHGHILRALGARWLGEEVTFGERLSLAPATLSRLGHEHGERVIEHWNAPASSPLRWARV